MRGKCHLKWPPDLRAGDEGACPFVTCLKTEKHTHPICPACGTVRFGNMFCQECLKQIKPGGLRWQEDQGYMREIGSQKTQLDKFIDDCNTEDHIDVNHSNKEDAEGEDNG